MCAGGSTPCAHPFFGIFPAWLNVNNYRISICSSTTVTSGQFLSIQSVIFCSERWVCPVSLLTRAQAMVALPQTSLWPISATEMLNSRPSLVRRGFSRRRLSFSEALPGMWRCKVKTPSDMIVYLILKLFRQWHIRGNLRNLGVQAGTLCAPACTPKFRLSYLKDAGGKVIINMLVF